MDEFASPRLPKGRGVWLSHIAGSRDVGHSKLTRDSCEDTGLGQSPGSTPVSGLMRDGPLTSTPGSDLDAIHHLTDMVGQLGAQIGESIVAKLMSAGVVNMNSDHQTTTTQNTHCDVDQHDRSPHVTVHVNSDKGLQTFRGDNTDKYPVQDWIDMTKTHLRKREIPVCDQAEEVMSHLMGKARDVVKIALRSDPTLDVKQRPELMYNVLLHYFSVAPSCLPLADFYATLPKHRENPVDYWIRLNKAADLALEGLSRQGKRTENMNDEVALMFVKHCPDPELSCTLKCKPLHEWTSRDVQLRIDDYQRELRVSGGAAGTAELKNYVTAAASEQPSQSSTSQTVSVQCLTPSPSPFSLQGQHHVRHPPCPSPASTPGQGEPHVTSYPSVPAVAQNLQQSEERLLTRVVDMFQEMMEKMQLRDAARPMQGGRFQRAYREKRVREAVCKV
ncbi:uncharacterized protein LOC142932666 [Anarhichas minor]|uniref:uncharacterized protein LOC142932666 n=1 Tax=Anarhichas minor TaxID=65739 RepID=UPI003F73352B